MDEEKVKLFGDFIHQKRISCGHTLTDVAGHLGITRQLLCDIEKGRRAPFKDELIALFSEYFELSGEDTALMYDLASHWNKDAPHDIEEILKDDNVGFLARYALRQSKAGNVSEARWKRFIQEIDVDIANGQSD